MGLRRRSIRLRIFLLVAIPILALTGLYAFAAATTTGAALSLARARTVKNNTGVPTGDLEGQVDTESMLAVVYLAAPVPPDLAALRAQEAKTDKARAVFSAAVGSGATMGSAGSPEKQAAAALLRDTGPAVLGTLRTEVTSRAISRNRAVTAYGSIVAAADNLLNQVILQETNVRLATQSLTLVRLGHSEQILLDEDALVNGDLAARSFSAAGRQQFAELVGARRTILALTLPDLDPANQAIYLKDVSPQASAALAALENTVIADPSPHGIPPVSPASWNAAVGAVSAGLSRAGFQTAEALTVQAEPLARSTFLRLFTVGGLGLLAVLLSIIMSIWIGRGLLRDLAGLRRSALELANDRLPSVMERLRAGQDVDVSAEAPPLEPLEAAGDEIGQVRQAFNVVQRTAIEAAVDEARLRRGISDVFRNLARRSQSLLHRQLALLDGMERRASGPEELEDLFRIDHLTTRMRRHAEGLIILSGESPGRGWRHPVPLVDVLRAAVAEVEDYTRIRVVSRTQAALAGPAVADVIHLIAELAENATIYSPPNTPVRIFGDVVGRGFAVEIEDRGLGIEDGKLEEINTNLASPPQFDLSGSDRLGLFIAGQLASRHDIKITLRPSAYGGTTAIVLIPSELVVGGDAGGPQQLAAAGSAQQLADADGAQQLAGISGSQQLARTSDPQQLAGPERAIRLAGRHAALRQADDAFDDPHLLPGPPAPAPASWVPAVGGIAATVPAARPPADDASAGRPLPPDRAPDLAGEPASQDHDPAADSRTNIADPAAFGLPMRIRQASLAPQLRDSGAAAPAPSRSDGAPSPSGNGGFFSPADSSGAFSPPGNGGAASPSGYGSADAEPARIVPEAARPPADDASAGRPLPPDRAPDLAGEPASQDHDPAADSRTNIADPAAFGLPMRIRQASLAPQLRDSGAPAPAGDTGADAAPAALSPEAARNTMAALQQGWERGRSASGSAPDILPDPDPEPDRDPEPEPATGELTLDGTDD